MTSTKNSGSEEEEEKQKPIVVRNTTDLQRLKLEKLMQNPVGELRIVIYRYIYCLSIC